MNCLQMLQRLERHQNSKMRQQDFVLMKATMKSSRFHRANRSPNWVSDHQYINLNKQNNSARARSVHRFEQIDGCDEAAESSAYVGVITMPFGACLLVSCDPQHLTALLEGHPTITAADVARLQIAVDGEWVEHAKALLADAELVHDEAHKPFLSMCRTQSTSAVALIRAGDLAAAKAIMLNESEPSIEFITTLPLTPQFVEALDTVISTGTPALLVLASI